MTDYDYESWLQYLENIITRHTPRAKKIVDLACGTGNFTIGFAARGYDVLGIDSSEDMLCVANEKALSMELSIPFVHQDMRNLSLHGPVDIITCMCDGFNYILSSKDLELTFQRIYNFLKSGGALIFDVSSYHKLKKTLGDNLMADASEDISLIWFNAFDPKDDICRMDLTFFIKEDDTYIRFDETHYQKAYKLDEIVKSLENVGFTDINVYTPLTFDAPNEEDQRWVFVAKK